MQYIRSNALIAALVMTVTILLLTGCRADTSDDPEEEIAELRQETNELRDQVESLQQRLSQLEEAPLVTEDGRVKLAVYFGLSTDTDTLTIPVLLPADAAEDLHREALHLLISGPNPDSPLSPIMPPDTEVLSLEVQDGMATVDFSPEVAEHAVGTAGESTVLAGIVNTLTEFGDIDRVTILVDGEEGVSLGGHYMLDEPLERFDDLIP